MFRIEPLEENFLKTRPDKIICRIPPNQFTFIELQQMEYLDPEDTFIIRHYKLDCQIVASGIYMYQNMFKSTQERTFYLIKTVNKNFYYLMKKGEENTYMYKKKPKQVAVNQD
ncbi:MAG TPA: hypothetical protein VK890_07195 [Bacteroidia bacterium]|jgi:hypothetical protein|nr:hypothetical protein [Bacteroidia bacterium]